MALSWLQDVPSIVAAEESCDLVITYQHLDGLVSTGRKAQLCLLGLFLSQFSTLGYHDAVVFSSPVFNQLHYKKMCF